MYKPFKVFTYFFLIFYFYSCKPTPEQALEEKILHSIVYRKYWEAKIEEKKEDNLVTKQNLILEKTKSKGLYFKILTDKKLKIKDKNEKLIHNGFYVSEKIDSLRSISIKKLLVFFDSFPELKVMPIKKRINLLVICDMQMMKQYNYYKMEY